MSRRRVTTPEPRKPGTRRQELLMACKTLHAICADILSKGEEICCENARVVSGAEEKCNDIVDCYIELSQDVSKIVAKINTFNAKFMTELEEMDKK